MGNSVLAGATVPVDNLAQVVFESSLAADLQARVQAWVDSRILADSGAIVDVNLSGAGDGHAFMVSVIWDTQGDAPAVGTVVRFYTASSEPEFALAAAAALATLQGQGLAVLGRAESGSNQGRHWMGMLAAQPLPS